MHAVNYFRVVGCEHYATKRAEKKEGYRKDTEAVREAYEDLPISQ